jgi:hypothetical protein
LKRGAKKTARKSPRRPMTAKKKPTQKSAKKKAAKKKSAAPRRRPEPEAHPTQPVVELSAPEAPQPVSIPGAWPFPMGPRP